MKHSIILFLTLAFGYSQGMNDDIKLAQVRVSGNGITSENTIVFTAGLREGQTITPADFPRAIKKLWQLGLFQDIQIQYDEETNEGLSLTIIVKENLILGEIKYEGNKKLKDLADEEISQIKSMTNEILKNISQVFVYYYHNMIPDTWV